MKNFELIDWAEVYARLHPVLLHLPIGLFVALAWIGVWGWFKGSAAERNGTRSALVFLLLFSTPIAAASGWLLHEGANYPDPVSWHEWCGIGLAFVAILVAWAHAKGSSLYGPLVGLGFLLLFPTAHFGGTLTHGEGFLSDPLMEGTSPVAVQVLPVQEAKLVETTGSTELRDAQPAVVEPELLPLEHADVLPILERVCTRCHGERKQKSGLAMHTMEALLIGGDSGPALVPGKPEESLLLIHVLLPLDEDEHMPPPKKSQPTAEELEILEAWVRGEPYRMPELVIADDPVVEAVVEAEPEPEPDPAALNDAMETLRTRLAHVQAVAPDTDALWIDFTASDIEPGELRALLEPLQAQVHELCLAGLTLDQADLDYVGSLPALVRLDLRRTPLLELDFNALAATESIQWLNLAGTPLAPAALETLQHMESLQHVYLWGTGLESDAGTLQEARPGLLVNAGVAPGEALDVEPEVVFERLVKPAVASDDTESAPLNTVCPVTQKPVDSRYVILHEGRAIGFCCPNCPNAFWADPDKFLSILDAQ